jgi:hypothetical protein
MPRKLIAYLPLFIVGLAAFLRFHNLPHLFIFGTDEEYQTNLAQTIIKDFHIIWILEFLKRHQ